MTGSQISFTLSIYILSIAIALILSILKKNISGVSIKVALIIHASLFVILILSLIVLPTSGVCGYFLLFFFCSGIVTAGYFFRSRVHTALQAYFALYLLSIILFIYSPSFLVRLISLNMPETGKTDQFRLKENYFLEEQLLMMNINDSLVQYKITQHFGVFHKTLARDIRFGCRIDSLKVLSFDPATEANVRAYIMRNSVKFASIDSLDLNIRFNLNQNEPIHKNKYH